MSTHLNKYRIKVHHRQYTVQVERTRGSFVEVEKTNEIKKWWGTKRVVVKEMKWQEFENDFYFSNQFGEPFTGRGCGESTLVFNTLEEAKAQIDIFLEPDQIIEYP